MSGGVVASVLLHGGLVAAFLLAKSSAPAPSPQMIQVHMVAAPAGDRAAGLVQEAVAAQPETPPPLPKTTAVKPKPVPPTAKPKTAPKLATPTTAPKPAESKPVAAAPTAGGGSTGGRGADVANIDTPGIAFDYPAYTTNIVRELVRRFGALAGSLEAEVRFVIKRDGSVDPASIRLVTPSGNYSFDQRALSAVETAANAKAFGALPAGFREDILPVTFRFSPKVIR
jgi:outer membrane biosynthesis protein TonB